MCFNSFKQNVSIIIIWMRNSDVLIVGSGIAGLSLALKLAKQNPQAKINVITKTSALESNTSYAQGGIAAVLNTLTDSYEEHIADTLASGKGLCDENIVDLVIKNATKSIHELINMGVVFDKDNQGNIALALEGGHNKPRVIHHKDKTGFEVANTLIKLVEAQKNINLITHLFVAKLITINNAVMGVSVYDEVTQNCETLYAKITVLATGGCGQLFENTTNPEPATGDGYAMAKRAGANLKHMRFVQFHPTALYVKNKQQTSFLISEAVRGFGAYITDKAGCRFLFKYDLRGELATRDVVSNAINTQLALTNTACAYLDLRHLNHQEFSQHFPSITQKLTSLGYNLRTDLIPIVPSAHYQCGGIEVNQFAQTSLTNLYALGEVSCTGLHGKNRLASNSLLEALVFANQAAINITELLNSDTFIQSKSITATHPKNIDYNWINPKMQVIKKWMSLSFSTCDVITLHAALKYMQILQQLTTSILNNNNFSIKLMQLNNMACVAGVIIEDLLNNMNEDTTNAKSYKYNVPAWR